MNPSPPNPDRSEAARLRKALRGLERQKATHVLSSQAHERLSREMSELRSALRESVERLLGPAEADELSLLDPELPLILFPVRIETRFVRGTPTDVLRVRLYPDQVHVDTFEPLLSEVAWAAGRQWRKSNQEAGGDEQTLSRAWNRLAGRFGAQRAKWIARFVIEHESSDDAEIRAEDMTHAPVARTLPDRWVLLAKPAVPNAPAESFVGPIIPDSLAVSASFEDPPDLLDRVWTDVAAGGTAQDRATEGIRWMLDFSVALRAGMAFEIPLVGARGRGFDLLLAYGVCASGEHDSAPAVDELLRNHAYTSGLSFVQQGTPTNNVEGKRAGFASRGPAGAPPSEGSAGEEDSSARSERGLPSNDDVTAKAFGVGEALRSLDLAGGHQDDSGPLHRLRQGSRPTPRHQNWKPAVWSSSRHGSRRVESIRGPSARCPRDPG